MFTKENSVPTYRWQRNLVHLIFFNTTVRMMNTQIFDQKEEEMLLIFHI